MLIKSNTYIARSITYCLFLLWIISLLSCGQDALDTEKEGHRPDETEVLFAMQIPGHSLPASKTLPATEENRVRTVDILVFEAGGNFNYITSATNITGNNDNSVQTFTATLATGSADLMLLANAREQIEASFGGQIPKGTLRSDIEEKITLFHSGKWVADATDPDYRPIPMWGEKKNVLIEANTSFTGANRISMSRMLARVDVTLAAAVQPDFKLKEVYLYHPYTIGRIIPDPAGWNAIDHQAVRPSLLPDWSAGNSYLLYDTEVTDTGCEAEIYTFEAPAGSTADFTDNTFLVIGGEYKGEMSYYRIDFARTEASVTDYLPILRNHKYRVSIEEIPDKGFSTHQLAAQSLPMNINVEVTVQDEGGSATTFMTDSIIWAQTGSRLLFGPHRLPRN